MNQFVLNILRIIVLSTGFLLAIAPQSSAQLLPFRTYSIEDGLSESVINHITQDRDGFIWIATEYGLNRFNGRSMVNYFTDDGLHHNKLNTLFVDSQNRLWIGSDAGVNIMVNDTIKAPNRLSLLEGNYITAIFEDTEGNMWFGTNGSGVWLLDKNGEWTQYTRVNGLANNRVRDIVEDYNGVLWFGTRNGLSQLKDGNFRTFSVNNGLSDEKIRDLHLDDRGNLWIATRNGLTKYDGNDFSGIENYNLTEGYRLTSITPFGKNEFMIGTDNGLLHLENGKFSTFHVHNGLSNDHIVSIFRDDQNGIWLGTYGGGVNYLPGMNIQSFTHEQGLPNNMISSFARYQSKIVVGTYGGGISFLVNNSFKTFQEGDGLVNNKVYTMLVDQKERLLIGTRWGLSIYDKGEFTSLDHNKLPARKIRTIHESRTEDAIWLGTLDGGLIKKEGDKFTTLTKEDGLSNNTIRDIEQDEDGTLWVATYGGVNRYGNGAFQTIGVEDGLPNNGVNDIEIDSRGYLWFATYNGLVKYDENEEKMTIYDTGNGMIDEVCYFVKEEKDGIYWIGSNKGLIRFNSKVLGSQVSRIDTSQAFQTITDNQGLISNELNTQAVLIEDGTLWAGTVGGVSRLDLDNTFTTNYSPPVHITGIRQFDTEIDPGRHFELDNNQNYLAFSFIGLDYRAPDQMVYEYRLRGANDKWERTTTNEVQYSALPPDNYTFEVRARNFDNMWSTDTRRVSFTILAPFWQRWWFYGLTTLGIIGIIVFFYHYYRINKMVELERMRVQIASDLHDDVGASLTEIALQTDFLQTSNTGSEVKQMLREIGDQSRKIVSSLDDIVWTIDARNDTIGDLTDRMQDHANKMLNRKDITVTYNFKNLDMDETLPVEERENIYLIFKEAVNNIAKHSNANHVWVEMQYNKNNMDLEVRDDGTTTKSNGRKTGQGLRNMNMRGERIGADVEISNKNGFTVKVIK